MPTATTDPYREQRMSSLALANERRIARASERRRLASAPSQRDALERVAELITDPPAYLHSMTVFDLVRSCRTIGPRKAALLLPPSVLLNARSREVGNLTPGEKGRVLSALYRKARG